MQQNNSYRVEKRAPAERAKFGKRPLVRRRADAFSSTEAPFSWSHNEPPAKRHSSSASSSEVAATVSVAPYATITQPLASDLACEPKLTAMMPPERPAAVNLPAAPVMEPVATPAVEPVVEPVVEPIVVPVAAPVAVAPVAAPVAMSHLVAAPAETVAASASDPSGLAVGLLHELVKPLSRAIVAASDGPSPTEREVGRALLGLGIPDALVSGLSPLLSSAAAQGR